MIILRVLSQHKKRLKKENKDKRSCEKGYGKRVIDTKKHVFPLKVFTSHKESVSFLGIRKTAADKNENNRMICKQ